LFPFHAQGLGEHPADLKAFHSFLFPGIAFSGRKYRCPKGSGGGKATCGQTALPDK